MCCFYRLKINSILTVKCLCFIAEFSAGTQTLSSPKHRAASIGLHTRYSNIGLVEIINLTGVSNNERNSQPILQK
jgi:hypothetical protein